MDHFEQQRKTSVRRRALPAMHIGAAYSFGGSPSGNPGFRREGEGQNLSFPFSPCHLLFPFPLPFIRFLLSLSPSILSLSFPFIPFSGGLKNDRPVEGGPEVSF